MSLFQSNIKVDHEQISQIVKKNWNIELGQLIKGSQNHTFQGKKFENGKQHKFSIRVTPDPEKKHRQRITNQIFFVNYLTKNKLNRICSVVLLNSSQHNFIYFDQKVIICVFEWARGQLLNFVQFQWMQSKQIVYQWGRFFAELHKISRKFQQQHSQIAKKIQRWDQIHHSILKGTKLHQNDQKVLQNPQHYGVLHGDLNCSNFFYDKQQKILNVFDTDQVQRGFFLWDVSQAIFTVYMLQQAGMPISCIPVPNANRKQFQEWILQGYQSVSGIGTVDLQRMQRMVLLKKQFYIKFCTRAVQEGNIPEDMKPFIQYIANTLGKQK